MDSSKPDISSNEVPYPPRYWWLKRIGVAIFVSIVAIILVNLWWAHVADRRYQALIDGAHSRGEPILPEDFDAAPVPDAQNKAAFLRKAADTVKLAQEFDDLTRSHQDNAPFSGDEMAVLTRTMSANAQALRLARLARNATEVNWQIPVRTPVLNSSAFTNLNDQRSLARLLSWSAKYNHRLANDHESVEALRDAIDLAHTLGRGPSTLVVELVSIGINALAIESIEEIAPTLNIAPDDASNSSGSATHAQISQLIATLLDDETYLRKAIRGWYGERMFSLDTFDDFINGNGTLRNGPTGIGTSVPFRASIKLDALRAAGYSEAGLDAVKQPNWPAAESKLPHLDSDRSNLENISSLLSRMLTPSVGRAVEQYFRETLERRVAAAPTGDPSLSTRSCRQLSHSPG